MTTTLFDRPHSPRLRFDFGATWLVEQWDGHETQQAFQRAHPGRGAVDFVAERSKTCWMIEVTDYRGYGVAFRQAWKGEDLKEDIAHKVAGTDEGLRWAEGQQAPEPLKTIAGTYATQTGKTPVVLWLEDGKQASKAELSVRAAEIKVLLKPLNVRVLLMNRDAEADSQALPNVVVSSLASPAMTATEGS